MTGAIGFVGYVVLLASGYAYNLTFVQLGLTSFGHDRIGLSDAGVAAAMGGLAVATCAVALAAGWRMRGWRLRAKLRAAAIAIVVQTALTAGIGSVTTPVAFAGWLAVAALALGLAIPATFGLASDLVATRMRGWAAAMITGAAYAGSILMLGEWDARLLADRLAPLMAVGAIGLVGLVSLPGPGDRLIRALERQARDDRFAVGRFAAPGAVRTLILAAVVLFGVFFVDSLGFVRLVDSAYIGAAWQSPDGFDRATLIGAHLLGAIAAGVLYTVFDERVLLPWIFGIFALVALMYVADIRAGIGGPSQVLVMPILYAVGVSLYTVVTFALWADLSTSADITWNVAVGVALSAWSATFLSTALALGWRTAGLDLDAHLSAVAAVGLVVLGLYGLRAMLAPRMTAMP